MKWILGVSLIAVAMGWAATAMIPTATASIDDVSLKFLPPETEGIVFIDVAALRNAPLVQDAMSSKTAGLAFEKGLGEFIGATGFDPERDVDRITIGKVGAKDGLVVVQGRIDKFKIEQFLKDKGKQPEAYLGQTLYHDKDGAIVLLDNVVIIGQLNAVKKAVDQMQLPGSLPLRSELMAAIQTIDAGNQIWGVGEISANDLGSVGVRGPAPVAEMLKSLRGGTFQMLVDTGIHARATGNFADAESVKSLGDLARGALAIGKLQLAKQQPDILRLLDGIQISYSGTTLTVRVEESGELLKNLKGLAPTIERNLR